MRPRDPSSGVSRHFLPQGEKEESGFGASASPSPLAGEGARRADEGSLRAKQAFAKHLRKNSTDVEKKLWAALRGRKFEEYKFRRQVPIGKYIVDFVCLERRLIAELDGSQHEGSAHDAMRDAWLKSQHFRILRFWNIDINQALDGTLLAILDALKAAP